MKHNYIFTSNRGKTDQVSKVYRGLSSTSWYSVQGSQGSPGITGTGTGTGIGTTVFGSTGPSAGSYPSKGPTGPYAPQGVQGCTGATGPIPPPSPMHHQISITNRGKIYKKYY